MAALDGQSITQITIPRYSNTGFGGTTIQPGTASTTTATTTADSTTGTTQTLSYPLDSPKYTMNFTIYQYQRQNLNSVGTLNLSSYPAIVMPLPQQLIDTNHVQWEELAVGTLPGTIINSTFNNISNRSAAAATALGAAGGAAIGSSVIGAGAELTGVAEATQGVEAVLGFSPNQFVTLLMRGPTYKRHQFTWEVSPTNFQEADVLRQIVMNFKNAMAPNYFQIGNGTYPVVWSFPKIFKIGLYPNSLFMYKFKPCVCDYFKVNYMPGGRGAFNINSNGIDGGNAPEGLQIQANFIELEYWIEGNYSATNDPYDTSNNTPDQTINQVITNAANAVVQATNSINEQLNIGGYNP